MAKFSVYIVIFLLGLCCARANEIVAVIDDKVIITSDEMKQNIKIAILMMKIMNDKKGISGLTNEALEKEIGGLREGDIKGFLNGMVDDKIVFLERNEEAMVDPSSFIDGFAKRHKIKDIDVFLREYGIRKTYFEERFIRDIVKDGIVGSICHERKIYDVSESEIMARLGEMKLGDDEEAKKRARYYIIMTRRGEIEKSFIKVLRKKHYIEILI
ncbi:hypothetical protein [Candidatus Deianiraea vastatrix]|uniref:Uncharacterized protein n=1 Tax=Candidatus Deianiraea vastatrix TaxID=2163644 RepID=A0A5B8XI20_9RICK|nr:hypothetical protein [Candidatus Deianiraea vastatrix]QED23681.1 hypothetical protein Deia_00894 [Candidatus Deianiraea vastatrix]